MRHCGLDPQSQNSEEVTTMRFRVKHRMTECACHCESAKRPSQSHYNMSQAVTNGSHLTVNCSQESTHSNLPSQGRGTRAPQDVTTFQPFNFSTFKLRKRTAFTLAEVLITLAIIGIVATLTIPTLVKNYQEKVLINKAKQAYSLMNNAINLYVAKNNCSNLLCLFDVNKTSDEVAAEFATVMKTAKLCENEDSSNNIYCKYHPIKTNKPSCKVNGKWGSCDNIGISGRMYLSNGMIFKIAQYNSCITEAEYIERDENGYATGNIYKRQVDRCAHIYIDTNNLAGPNQYGADIFRFTIKSDGSIAEYADYLKKIMQTNKLDYVEYNIGDEAK